MRGAEGTLPQQAGPRVKPPPRQQPGHRVELHHLQGLLAGQGRHQTRQSAGQHGLAAAGRPHQQQMVLARRGDLQGPAPVPLSLHVRQVRRAERRGQLLGRRPAPGGALDGPGRRARILQHPQHLPQVPPPARPAGPPPARPRRRFSGATSRPRAPLREAARAWASTPRTGRSCPSSPSSAADQTPSTRPLGSWPLAISSPRAIGRSNQGPSLRRSAGARLTTTRVSGTFRPLLRRAARTRSRASCTAVSASPTSCRPGSPGAMSTSTTTARPPGPAGPRCCIVPTSRLGVTA